MMRYIISLLCIFLISGCAHYNSDNKTFYGFGEIELDKEGNVKRMVSTLFPLPKLEVNR